MTTDFNSIIQNRLWDVHPPNFSAFWVKKLLAIPPNYMRLTLNYDRDKGAYRIDKIR